MIHQRIVPSTTFIEMGIDSLKVLSRPFLECEVNEFNALGDVRKVEAILGMPRDIGSNDFHMLMGYLLGLETARALIETNPKAIQAGVCI